jgi:hypothetical protein
MALSAVMQLLPLLNAIVCRTLPDPDSSPESDRRAADGSADCPTVTLNFILKDHSVADFDPYVQVRFLGLHRDLYPSPDAYDDSTT